MIPFGNCELMFSYSNEPKLILEILEVVFQRNKKNDKADLFLTTNNFANLILLKFYFLYAIFA